MSSVIKRIGAVLAIAAASLVFPMISQADTVLGSGPLSADFSTFTQTVSVPDSIYPYGQLQFTVTPQAETAVAATLLDQQVTGVPEARLTCKKGGDAGEVKYRNAGPTLVTLWTYASVVIFKHCSWTDSTGLHGKVTKVYNLFDEPVDTCCNWGWHGDVIVPQHSSLPTTALTTYTKASFGACLPWPISWCEDKYPWVRLKVNGFGKHTGFSFGW